MTTNAREKRMIMVGGIVVVGIVIWSLLNPVKPKAKQASMLSLTAAQAQTDTDRKQAADMKRHLEELEPVILQLSEDKTAQAMVPYIVRDLQKIARESGVRLIEVKPQRVRPTRSGEVEQVPIEVRFRASFQPNVISFLYFVEAPTHKMVVDNFNITSADARLKSVDVSARITVYTRKLSRAESAEEGESANDSAKIP